MDGKGDNFTWTHEGGQGVDARYSSKSTTVDPHEQQRSGACRPSHTRASVTRRRHAYRTSRHGSHLTYLITLCLDYGHSWEMDGQNDALEWTPEGDGFSHTCLSSISRGVTVDPKVQQRMVHAAHHAHLDVLLDGVVLTKPPNAQCSMLYVGRMLPLV